MTKRKTRDDDNFPSTLALPLDLLRDRSDPFEPAPQPAAKPRVRAPLTPELMAKYSLGPPRAVAPSAAPVAARRAPSSRFAALEPAAPPTTPARKASNSKFAALEPSALPRKTTNSKFAALEPAAAPAAPARKRSTSKFAALDEPASESVARAPWAAPAAVPTQVPAKNATPASADLAGTRQSATAATAASAAATEASEVPALRLVVRGFSAVERSLLDGTVKLSQRRTPRLQLLADSEVDEADVVMINALDARAMEWAQRQPSLAGKAVIWVDGRHAAPGHTLAKRPVQWPILPILLARALEQGPGTQARNAAPAAVESAAVSATASVEAVLAAGSPRPVLIVDDSLAVRAHLRSQLEARGYQVSEAENVEAAMLAISGTAFACVLMDVLMPGVDGYEGCKQIKAKLRGAAKLPVIMLTSKSSPFDRIRGKMAGCDAYLTKPVESKQLQETLAQYMPQPAGEAATQPAAQSAPRAARRTRPAPGLSDVI